MGERLSPGHRLKRQMALFQRGASFEARLCRAPQDEGARCRAADCRRPVGPNGLFCSAHYFALPARDARFLQSLQAAAWRTTDEETRRYLVEQIDGYANQYARQVAGANRA